ncbi:hypothetical protein ON010_g11812 [Phytophthora cinnamomi]|nr:hypothetical protein ON010_g11812 [Phytophthora cinnamomi]
MTIEGRSRQRAGFIAGLVQTARDAPQLHDEVFHGLNVASRGLDLVLQRANGPLHLLDLLQHLLMACAAECLHH